MLYFIAYKNKTDDAEGLHLLFSSSDDSAERAARIVLAPIARDIRVIGAIEEHVMAQNLAPHIRVPAMKYGKASFVPPSPEALQSLESDDNPVEHHFMAAAALRYAALEYSDVLGRARVNSLLGSAQKIERSLAEMIGL